MIKALLYDFDGVVKESTQLKTDAFYALYEPYGPGIANKVVEHHLANGGVSRFEKFRLYHRSFLNLELSEQEVDELAEKFSGLVFRKVMECPYVPGAREAIRDLALTLDQFIVTGTPSEEIEQITRELKLRSFFKGVYGSPETKVAICGRILEQTGFSPDELLFIGDALVDYEAARHFNMKFVLREHDENRGLFANLEVMRVTDLRGLPDLVHTL